MVPELRRPALFVVENHDEPASNEMLADGPDQQTRATESEWARLVHELVAERDSAVAKAAAFDALQAAHKEQGEALEEVVTSLAGVSRERAHLAEKVGALQDRLREKNHEASDAKRKASKNATSNRQAKSWLEQQTMEAAWYVERQTLMRELTQLRAELSEQQELTAELEDQLLRRTERLAELEGETTQTEE